MQQLTPLQQLLHADASLLPRAVAVEIVRQFLSSAHPLDTLLHRALRQWHHLSQQDRDFVTEVVYGTIRWKRSLAFLLRPFYQPPKAPYRATLDALLLSGAYQLLFLDAVPAYAAIDTTVELSKWFLRKSARVKLVNAVLRNLQRSCADTPVAVQLARAPLDIRYSFPPWLVRQLQSHYGDETEALLRSLNDRPLFGIRRNALKIDKSSFEQWLGEQTAFRQWQYDDRCYQVASVFALQQSEAYRAGWFSLQDPAAAMVIHVAAPDASRRILDCCAAPGGKTTFLAEWTKDAASIVALDPDPRRAERLRANVQRLGLRSVAVQTTTVEAHRPGEQYDLVLADVPCSDLGTIRKHPDIKWRKSAKQIAALQRQQRRILAAAADLLKPGGVLIYSTCTLTAEENEENIAWFLRHFPDFHLEPAGAFLPSELCRDGYLKILPHQFPTDAAFAARLRKAAS